MTGPEHYKAAESLLDDGQLETDGGVEQVALFARAQVHATLALAAATIIEYARNVDAAPADEWYSALR